LNPETANRERGVPHTHLARQPELSLLGGLKVVQLGTKVSASAAGKALLQLGADVSILEAGAEELSDSGAPYDGVTERRERLLNAGKTRTHNSVAGVKGRAMVASADVVLADIVDGTTPAFVDGDSSVDAYVRYVLASSVPAWVTISAFGISGSRRSWRATEFTTLAAGGILGHSRHGNDGEHIVPAGALSLRLAGCMGALAALHGLDRFASKGHAQHLDVSSQECVIGTGLVLEIAHALFECPGEGGSSRYGAPSGFFQCHEGSIFISVLEQHQWDGLRRAINDEELSALTSFDDRRVHGAQILDAVERWASSRTAVECETILQSFGVPCTAVNSVQQFLERTATAGREFPAASVDREPLPCLLSDTASSSSSTGQWSHGQDRIAGLRVLDAGQVLAVPLATSLLGAMGANVTKAEDLSRLDVYRRRGPFARGIAGLNRSAYFNVINHSKRQSIVYDSQGDSLEELASVVAEAEVVVQNLGPSRSKRLGLDVDSLLRAHPNVLGVVSSGFGSTGAWSSYRAYGHNLHAFAGLVALTRDSAGHPADMGTPWIDPLTGVFMAILVSAWASSTARDRGLAVDVSMAELMVVNLLE
jgi:crotonobetainyl-CoA:carnitine CoA-transferase CaiB-like acyl-CoA transferase